MQKLTRQELYDLVWSTPMTKLAADFGISDVGLAKICIRHRVPTPSRGYWAQKESGKKVKQAIFVRINDPLLDRIEIASHRSNLPEPVREIVETRRAERKALAKPAQPVMMTPPSVNAVKEPHPAIKATVRALRTSRPSESNVIDAFGPGLCGISISIHNVERIISIMDQLARSFDARGIVLSPADTRLSAAIGRDAVSFEIKEKTKRVPHVLTKSEIEAQEKRRKRNERRDQSRISWDFDFSPGPPEFDFIRTGELSLEAHEWNDGLRKTWRDGKTQVLETLIGEIIDGLEAHIVANRLKRETQERKELERKELARRHGLAKARKEREATRKKLVRALVRNERLAEQMRDWLARTALQGATDSPEIARLIAWIRGQLSELDNSINPAGLAKQIQERKLFPEIDELDDPLGDPPPMTTWW